MRPSEPDRFAPTRESLIARLKNADDHEGWSEFFATYGRLIYSVARRSGLDDNEAQDLVQETVLSVSRKIAGFRYDPSLGTFKNWLMIITRSRISDYLRRKRRRPVLVGSPPTNDTTTFLSGTPDPELPALEQTWEGEWQEHLLSRALESVKSQVSMQHYQIFDLAAVQWMPAPKIAATLGVSVAKVYIVKHRVTRLVKSELARIRARLEDRHENL